MKTLTKFGVILLLAITAVACGPKGKKSGLTGGGGKGSDGVPDLPVGDGTGTEKPITVDARADFAAAVTYYQDNDSKGWSESACRGAAEKFAAVAREHKFVEAQYMVGRSYHACNLLEDAEKAYQGALDLNPKHAESISNLGELYYQVGKRDGAKKYWEAAVEADPKIVAARANLAMLLLEDLRVTKGEAEWKKLEQAARDHLSSVLAVDNDHLKAYVLYGLVYMEGREKNKNRLELAKLLLDEAVSEDHRGKEAAERNAKYAPLQHALGLYYLYKNNLTQALIKFSIAVELDPNFAEARQNVGLINLGFRKYDIAKEHFNKVLDLDDNKNYDALIGLGVANRGLNDLEGAEAAYKKAKELDGKRGEALFNLGVLYKDFMSSKSTDTKGTIAALKTARDYFKEYLTKDVDAEGKADAKDNISDCDKNITVYESFKSEPAEPAAPANP